MSPAGREEVTWASGSRVRLARALGVSRALQQEPSLTTVVSRNGAGCPPHQVIGPKSSKWHYAPCTRLQSHLLSFGPTAHPAMGPNLRGQYCSSPPLPLGGPYIADVVPCQCYALCIMCIGLQVPLTNCNSN